MKRKVYFFMISYFCIGALAFAGGTTNVSTAQAQKNLQSRNIKADSLSRNLVDESKVRLEANYIVSCQYLRDGDPANGAINDIYGNPTFVVPRENGMAILGLLEAARILNDSLYSDRAQLAANYLVSIQDQTDGAWCDQYSYQTAVDLSKSPTQTAEVMMAFFKLGYQSDRYPAMKKGAQYLLACQNVANKTGNDDGLICGGKDDNGIYYAWRWASDNSYAFWALRAACDWAILGNDIAWAAQFHIAAENIRKGINQYLYVSDTQDPDYGVWRRALNEWDQPVEVYYHEWINYAPQMVDVPAQGVGAPGVGEWIHAKFQKSDGSCVFDDYQHPNKKSPGFTFQASLSWQDLGKTSYANAGINWAENSGLWQTTNDPNGIKGGWIDWTENGVPADWWWRFIDTSFYSIAAWNGGYNFQTTQPFTPPTAALQVGTTTVQAGQPFTVTVTGNASLRLASVWWFVEDTNNRSFHQIPGSVDGNPVNVAAAQDFGAGFNLLTYTYSHSVVIAQPGNYEIISNSRDRLYPTAGEAHQASEGLGMAVVAITVTP